MKKQKRFVFLIAVVVIETVLLAGTLFYLSFTHTYSETLEIELSETNTDLSRAEKELAETKERLLINTHKLEMIQARNEGIQYQEQADEQE